MASRVFLLASLMTVAVIPASSLRCYRGVKIECIQGSALLSCPPNSAFNPPRRIGTCLSSEPTCSTITYRTLVSGLLTYRTVIYDCRVDESDLPHDCYSDFSSFNDIDPSFLRTVTSHSTSFLGGTICKCENDLCNAQ